MNNAWKIPQYGEDKVDPELSPNTYSKENTKWWDKY